MDETCGGSESDGGGAVVLPFPALSPTVLECEGLPSLSSPEDSPRPAPTPGERGRAPALHIGGPPPEGPLRDAPDARNEPRSPVATGACDDWDEELTECFGDLSGLSLEERRRSILAQVTATLGAIPGLDLGADAP